VSPRLGPKQHVPAIQPRCSRATLLDGKQLLIAAADRTHRVITNLAAMLLFLKGDFLHIFNKKSDRCHIKSRA